MIFLYELLKDWPSVVEGNGRNVWIRKVTEHSKRVEEGSLFIARKGVITDGNCYVREAVRRGAVAVVVDRYEHEEWPYDIPLVIVSDCQLFLAYSASILTGNPAQQLQIVAVTGTNGKTTVTHYVGQLLRQVNVKTAIIGTLGVYIDCKHIPFSTDPLTTLSAEHFHPILQHCVKENVKVVILEASSMGLAQRRLAYCPIHLGVLLNVGEDHYEEHGGKEAYLQAKKILVDQAQSLLVNGEDEVCCTLTKHRLEQKSFFTTKRLKSLPKEDQIILNQLVQKKFHFPQNIAAAYAIIHALNIPQTAVNPQLTLPEGRMESFEKEGVTVIVDYAHTPEALMATLAFIHATDCRYIRVVFGCGGNRDQEKRAKMGQIAARYASKIYLTSDNPRNENPLHIIKQIQQGIIPTDCPSIIQVDRQQAIEQAILEATEGEVILVAGKGHECTQQIGQQVIPFSDRQVVQEALRKKYQEKKQ